MKRPATRHVRAVIYALFFCVLLSFHSVAADCRGDENVLVPAWHNGRIGFIDATGNLILAPQFGSASLLSEYSSIGRFSDGLAAVGVVSNRQTKFGFIDTTGKIVIVPQFDMVRRFSEGMAVIGEFDAQRRTHRKGFIDRTGSVVVQPTYLIVSDFEDGLAEVHVRGSERWSRKRGYINKTGNFVWDPAEPPTRSSNQAQEDTARKRADPQR